MTSRPASLRSPVTPDGADGRILASATDGRALRRIRLHAVLQSQQSRFLFALVCLAVLGMGTFRLIRPQDYQAADFGVYYDAAVAIRHGNNPYVPTLTWIQSFGPGGDLESYIHPSEVIGDQAAATPDYAAQTGRLGVAGRVYLYAPMFAVLLIPLTFLSLQAAFLVWGICNFLFLVGAVYALDRLAGSRRSPLSLLVLLSLASLMSAVRGEYFLGQANLFLVACVCGALYLRQERRTGLAALLLALAFVTKPWLLVIAVFLVWKREFKFVFASIAGLGLFLVSPFLWLGADVFGDLLNVWNFASANRLLFVQNISPRGLLDQLLTVNPFAAPLIVAPVAASILWLLTVALVAVLSLAMIAPCPLQRDSRSVLEVGVMVSAFLLISPLTEPMYLVFLLVPWVAVFTYLRGRAWQRAPFVWAALGLIGLWVLELRFPATASVTEIQGPFILVASFALQIFTLRVASGRPLTQSVRRLVQEIPALGTDCLRALAELLSRRNARLPRP